MSTDPLVLRPADHFGQIGEYKMTSVICRVETPGLFVRVAALRAPLAAHWSALVAGYREGQQIAARYRELSQLSRADLAKRGLTRQTIGRAALRG